MTWPLKATIELTHDDYVVAWMCALPIEKTAARNMLDELHLAPPQPEHDKNIYTFGRICGHNVVIVCQGDMGTTAASVVAVRMDSTFRKLRFGLLVGSAGGVPDKKDIRLGDVVISKGDGKSGGVVARDRGKATLKGFESKPFLNGVPEVLRNSFSELESRLMDHDSKITAHISEATARNYRFSAFERPTSLKDNLFQSDYAHVSREDKRCADCDNDYIVARPPRDGPLIHFGVVASGNQVIKSATERAKILAAHPGVLAVEMEAAGLMDVFGCATIQGICNYCDSHKNDSWRKYASASAAAAAKEVLEIIPVSRVIATPSTAVAGIPISHWLVPFPRNERFVGRDSQLDELATKLSSGQFCQLVAITGLGGIGKTQIVLEYAYRIKEESPEISVFWVPANSYASFEKGYADIADCLKLTAATKEKANVKQLVKVALSQESSGPWILIIDNADDIDLLFKKGGDVGSLPLVDYLPANSKEWSLESNGQHCEAEQMYRQVLDLRVKVFSIEHQATLASMYEVARSLNSQGYYREAEQMLQQELELCTMVLGPEHGDTLMSISSVAEVLRNQGSYHKAEQMHKQVLKLYTKVLGQEHPNTLASMNNVALALSDQGNYYKAEQMHEQVLQLRTKVLGPKHPDILTSMSRVAQALSYQSNYYKAGQMHKQVLELNIKVLGPEHPYTLTSMYNVGAMLSCQGKAAEAEEMLQKTLALSEKVLGKEHPETLIILDYLIQTLDDQGKDSEAMEMHQKMLTLKKKESGQEEPLDDDEQKQSRAGDEMSGSPKRRRLI